MTITHLLDTNILSEPTRSTPNPNVLAQLAAHSGHVATTSICIHELAFGIERLPPGSRRTAYEGTQRVRPAYPVLDR